MFLSALLVAFSADGSEIDVGYEQLFTEELGEVDSVPLSLSGAIPEYMVGSFIQSGPGRWSWGGRKMTHILDGFSKLHKWDFKADGTVLFTSKFLRSGFYLEAEEINDIPLGVFAQPTDPPINVSVTEFMKAPNDNNQVNVIELGNGNLEILSDVLSMVEVDRESLDLTCEYNYRQCKDNVPSVCTVTKNLSNPVGQLNTGGSAHPYLTDNGDYIGLREIGKYAGIIPGNEGFAVYRVLKDQRDTIQDMVTIKVKKTSYAHSFGLPKTPGGHHVIVVAQPIHYDALAMAQKATLDVGLVKSDDTTRFYVAPLEFGAEAIEIDAPKPFFFGHVINSYLLEEGIYVLDVNIEDNIFFDRYSMDVQLSKYRRDSWPITAVDGVSPGYETATRFVIDTQKKTVTSKPLFGHEVAENIFNEHDLFKLHPADYGVPYCGYWAWQAFYNSSSFASWAIVRTELCGEKPVVAAAWHRTNVYPGEASFVPKPGSADKTEGVLTFHAHDGNTGKELLIVVDSKSMDTIAEAELPVHVPFTVHGNWFPVRPPSPPTPPAPTPKPTPPTPMPLPTPPTPTPPVHYGKPPCRSDETALSVRGGVVCAAKCGGGCPSDRPAGAVAGFCDDMMVDFEFPKNYCVIQCATNSNCGVGATCHKRNPLDIGVCAYAKDDEITLI